MRDIDPDIITALESSNFRPIFLIEIEFDTPLLFSSAYGTRNVGGKEYVGGGSFGKITSTKENTDLDPNSLEIELTGVSDSVLAAIGTTNYLNRDVTVSIGMLNDDGSIIGDTTFNYFVGRTDEVKYSFNKTGSITITARDRLADWSRPRVERNMNADQQARFPGDVGFEYVGQVTDKRIVWPKGEYFE